MKKSKINFRIIILAFFVMLLFIVTSLKLLNYQIVNGANYKAQSEKNSIAKQKIKAARGEIVDRYGRPLATNKIGYNVVFDRAFLPKDQENSIILSLINLFKTSSEGWIDEIPISKTQPYEFIAGKDEEIDKLKKLLNINTYATAENCIDQLIIKYKIEGYTSEQIREIAGVRYTMLLRDFSRDIRYVFAQDVSNNVVAKVKELGYNFPGVDIVDEAIREYVSGDIASTIIGDIGPIYAEEYEQLKKENNQRYSYDDKIGKYGVEKAMEKYLKGYDGVRIVEQNSKGEVISEKIQKEPVSGDTVMLTIDKNFQVEVQKILQNHINFLNTKASKGKEANAGAIVVIDVKTGDVLASANYPTYDINDYRKSYETLSKDPNQPLLDRAFNGLYRPGSTFKTVTATGDLMEGVVNPNTTIYCNGVFNMPGYNPTCTGHHGNINIINALKVSCNVYFYQTSLQLGIDKLNFYANSLGLGVETGLQIPTAKGRISSPKISAELGMPWTDGNIVQTAIGQFETAVSPLQMSIQAATIANKGTRNKSNIIQSVKSYDFDKTVLEAETTILSQLENKNNAFASVEEGMIRAANRVTAPYALNNLPYKVAIKTGTPEYAEKKYNSAVVGYAPVGNPEIAIGAIIEKGEYASYLIRPILEAYEKSKQSYQQLPQNSNTILP